MVSKAHRLELRLRNPAAQRGEVLSALKEFAFQHQLPPEAANAADLALEEHLTNVLNYAYNDRQPGEVVVRFGLSKRDFVVEVWDDGKPFNPLARPPVDITKPLAKKPIGGLGIHLMRHSMDDLAYARKSGQNRLTMRKRLARGHAVRARSQKRKVKGGARPEGV